ncbi:hypothetical protein [Frigidibacter sp. SD6-1]|uniref:hypothetical protein n=1 Tax=Frigidibacter sp. SD6-1 TaxID=3032581 RepID=UPI0024DF8C5C|nr:hypothetical protein [Frigidibacter sp. SD6-1]
MSLYETSPAVLEGRMHAHRQVLAALVAAVTDPRPETLAGLRALVSRDAVAASQSEDPGAVPDRAFAIQSSVAEELRLLADEVARIVAQPAC